MVSVLTEVTFLVTLGGVTTNRVSIYIFINFETTNGEIIEMTTSCLTVVLTVTGVSFLITTRHLPHVDGLNKSQINLV